MAYTLWRTYKFNFWMLCNGAGLMADPFGHPKVLDLSHGNILASSALSKVKS
jgi:hypothetical protein